MMKADCQHCGVHLGDIGDELHDVFKFCPFCGERILPVFHTEGNGIDADDLDEVGANKG